MEDGPYRMRLDSEYVWEGGEDMYEDIVASTQPNIYMEPCMRKQSGNSLGYPAYPTPSYLDDLDTNMDFSEQI
jgi:hypothetical protein